jgi:N-acetylglucosaminyl-diphospho-decaprenol L-rhamnosyltransferase
MADPANTASAPAVDTVFVAYRSEDVIERALAQAAPLGGLSVVVDHGDGESAQIAVLAGALAIHDPSNPGFGAGQNRGISFTGSEFVLLCNPDAEILPGAILAGAELLRARPGVAAAQGVIVNRSTGRPERSAGVELGPVHLLGRAIGAKRLLGLPVVASLARRSPILQDHADRVPGGPVEVQSLAATAVLVRRSALDQVGGFDESFFLYGEDLDLCRRLRAAGWTLVAVPEVWATHTSGGSAHSSWQREAEWWRGTMQFGAGRWSASGWSIAVLAAAIRWARLAAGHPVQAPATFRALVADPLRRRRSAAARPADSRRVRPAVRSAES